MQAAALGLMLVTKPRTVRNTFLCTQDEALLYISHLPTCVNLATIGNGSCTGDSIKSYDGADGPYYGFSCAGMIGRAEFLQTFDSPKFTKPNTYIILTYFQGVVGDNSCYEYSACYQNCKF